MNKLKELSQIAESVSQMTHNTSSTHTELEKAIARARNRASDKDQQGASSCKENLYQCYYGI